MTAATSDREVLVVEDDSDVREVIADVLADHGYRPLGAANGAEALELLRSAPAGQRPCVILLDIMMPVMDGFEFRAEQKKDPELASIPVIVLTAHAAGIEDVAEIEPAAALTKPVQLDTLLGTLDCVSRRAGN